VFQYDPFVKPWVSYDVYAMETPTFVEEIDYRELQFGEVSPKIFPILQGKTKVKFYQLIKFQVGAKCFEVKKSDNDN
jgi:hypothetical protein